jgi:hypothetical protein
MSIITLKTSLKNFLASQGIQIYIEPSIVSENGIISQVSKPVLLPPNTAIMDIRVLPRIPVSALLNTYNSILTTAKNSNKNLNEIIPLEFNWKLKNSNITDPPNQYLCGCCWAVSTATCIADVFVVNNFLNFNPNLCWTYLISCWNNDINLQCMGSNPCLALQWIEVYGVGSQKIKNCNYDWCSKQTDCTNKETSGYILNQQVPSCDYEAENNVKFFIKNVYGVSLNQQDLINDQILDSYFIHTKQHIMNVGPVVGGFIVFPNFLTGNFECNGKNPSNIYLENVNYKTQKYQPINPNTTIGSHAVVIIGWGQGLVEESLLKPNNTSTKKITVPYWIVRNSWGTSWGKLKGFFHMAFYPYNKTSQFDVTRISRTVVQNPKTGMYSYEDVPWGGIVTFEPNYLGYLKTNPKNQNIENFEYPSNSNNIIYFFIACMIALTIILFIIIICLKKKNLD